ncbi:MAG: hypothetical protein AB1540_08685 [Bdellovibrionota bacterium]
MFEQRTTSLIWVLTIASGIIAFFNAEAGNPASTTAKQLCTTRADEFEEKISELWPSVSKTCPECSRTTLIRILQNYHPRLGENSNAVESAVNNGPAIQKRRPIDIGDEDLWTGVKLQNSELREKAFGNQKCHATTARFVKGKSQVSFTAVMHVYIYPELKQEVFQSVLNEFNAFKPDAVVVEGYPKDFPCSEAVRIYLTPVSALEAESEYLAKLALLHAKPIHGGEPRQNDIGLKAPDREGFLFLRLLSSERPKEKIHEGGRLRYQVEAFNKIKARTAGTLSWTYDQFIAWYKTTNKRDFRIEDALDDITPSFNLNLLKPNRVLKSNHLSDEVGIYRDRVALSTVRRLLLTNDRVMTVYGRDHLPRQLPVYEAVFGKSATPIAKCGQQGAAFRSARAKEPSVQQDISDKAKKTETTIPVGRTKTGSAAAVK